MPNPHDVLRAVVARGVADGGAIVAIDAGSPAAFFYDHAGYSTPPGRSACALQLAEAEQWARDAGIKFVWEDDHDTYSHVKEFPDAYDHEPDSCEWCGAYLGTDVLASLGCIDDADADYRRVIEAELAQEARDLILSDLAKL